MWEKEALMHLGHRVRLWAGLVVMTAALSATSASAQQFGNGQDGVLEVNDTRAINDSALITAEANAGDYLLTVSHTTGFAAGHAVLVVQMQFVEGGARSEVGAFEMHRMTRVRAGTIELESPLGRAFPAKASQVVSLPEYVSVAIAPDAGLVAPAWNGLGGVLAFLCDGRITNNGRIDARGAGFRGGTGRGALHDRGGCVSLDEPAPGGSERGEGARVGTFGAAFTGRGNNDTGGGGGVCAFSGGGGGGHRGEGGVGGFSASTAATGGLPGASLSGKGLVLGGGGGAANGLNANPRNGGIGGGVVFIGARELTGRGVISSDGLQGGSVTESTGAASGGGAGGTVWLEIAGDAVCQISAAGGNGGNTVSTGPGGGGGGGLIRLQAQVVRSCTTSVSGGLPGLANQMAFGAGPLSPDVPPNTGEIDVVDVYGEEIPLPKDKRSALIGIGCGCDAGAGGAAVWLLVLALLRRSGRAGRRSAT